jgi:hypothetical protein
MPGVGHGLHSQGGPGERQIGGAAAIPRPVAFPTTIGVTPGIGCITFSGPPRDRLTRRESR